MEAEARGTLATLQSKAQGFRRGSDDATLLLVTEQLPALIEEQRSDRESLLPQAW
jgi:hypothetical protein